MKKILIILSLLILSACSSREVYQSLDTRAEQIDNQFSAWDGSHIKLTREIKKGMNDPESFDHIETRFKDLGNEIVVHESFRGKNSFGGLVINKVVATVDIEGNVLTMRLAK